MKSRFLRFFQDFLLLSLIFMISQFRPMDRPLNMSDKSRLQGLLDKARKRFKNFKWIAVVVVVVYIVVSVFHVQEVISDAIWIAIVIALLVVLLVALLVTGWRYFHLLKDTEVRKENQAKLEGWLALVAAGFAYSQMTLPSTAWWVRIFGALLFVPIYWLILQLAYISLNWDKDFLNRKHAKSYIRLIGLEMQLALIGLAMAFTTFLISDSGFEWYGFGGCYLALSLIVLLVLFNNESDEHEDSTIEEETAST